jgi:hypothetical protein
MQPQGTGVINVAYYNNAVARFGEINSCEQLTLVIEEVRAAIQAELDGIAAQLEALAPIVSLAEMNLTNLSSVIDFLTGFVDLVLGPLIKPYLTYTAQLAAMSAQIAAVLAAMQDAIDRLGDCDCSVPTITIPAVPPPP